MQRPIFTAIICIAITITFAAASTNVYSQDLYEQRRYANGLTYDAQTIAWCRAIVAAKHRALARLRSSRIWYSSYCATGSVLNFSGPPDTIRALLNDLQAGLSFARIRARYTAVLAQELQPQPMSKKAYTDEHGKTHWFVYDTYSGSVLVNAEVDSIAFNNHSVDGRWVAEKYFPGNPSDPAHLKICFFSGDFRRVRIPDRYTRLLRYVNCLMDTTTAVFLPVDESARGNVDDLERDMETTLELPPHPRHDADASWREVARADSLWNATLTERIRAAGRDTVSRAKVRQAVRLAIARNNSAWILEQLAEVCCSPKDLLALLRRRHLEGCGLFSPFPMRLQYIAQQAALAREWNVFVWAHVATLGNPLNTRDVPTAYSPTDRRSYIHETETMGIRVVDLLLGAALQYDGISPKHFQASPARMGQVMAESRDSALFAERALAMMRDPELDEMNRAMIFTMYKGFVRAHTTQHSRAMLEALRQAADTFPAELAKKIRNLDEDNRDWMD